jgi:hypothetical protein
MVTVRPASASCIGGADILGTVDFDGRLGRTARALIRPAGVQILPPGHSECHLQALVVDAAYRGGGYDDALLLGDGTQLIGIHDQRRWERGDNVAVRLSASACLLFDAGADGEPDNAAPAVPAHVPEAPAHVPDSTVLSG